LRLPSRSALASPGHVHRLRFEVSHDRFFPYLLSKVRVNPILIVVVGLSLIESPLSLQECELFDIISTSL
jgi:hypothetical protein